MVFSSKQLEELESIHDGGTPFEEEGDDEGGFDDVGEAAMDWRRGYIEEAGENVKRSKGRPVDPSIAYTIGSLLFDRDARRFARVSRSIPGHLRLVYLTGGDREFGLLDVDSYIRDYGATKKLSELSEQLGMADIDVAEVCLRLGVTPIEDEGAADRDRPGEETLAPVIPAEAKAARAKPAKVALELDDDEEPPPPPPDDDELPAIAAPAKGAKPAAAAARPAVKADASKAAVAAKPAAAKAERPADPLGDTNGYIKANFQKMSNRELARVTGLSEHTIRRKLGEWSLRRDKAL